MASSDYADDLKIGPEILKNFNEMYRKLRNTLRWMLGSLAHHDPKEAIPFNEMPELERLMLHSLAELDPQIRKAYAEFDYKRIVALLSTFMNTELSAFYFDIRKDALYCDPISSRTRRAALSVIDKLCDCLTKWLAPILVFTAEEVFLARHPEKSGCLRACRALPESPDGVDGRGAGGEVGEDRRNSPRRHRGHRGRESGETLRLEPGGGARSLYQQRL